MNQRSCFYIFKCTCRVLLVGDVGQRFQLTRSVRQGCPLAPFLFLIYFGAMSLFIRHDHVVASQLVFRRTLEPILDSNFADYPTIYTKGTNENLHTLYARWFLSGIKGKAELGKDSRILDKSCASAILESPCEFHVVCTRLSVWYLGSRIGLDLSMDQVVAPLLLNRREK